MFMHATKDKLSVATAVSFAMCAERLRSEDIFGIRPGVSAWASALCRRAVRLPVGNRGDLNEAAGYLNAGAAFADGVWARLSVRSAVFPTCLQLLFPWFEAPLDITTPPHPPASPRSNQKSRWRRQRARQRPQKINKLLLLAHGQPQPFQFAMSKQRRRSVTIVPHNFHERCELPSVHVRRTRRDIPQ